MTSVIRVLVNQLWPKSVAPRLRSVVVQCYRRMQNIPFLLWRTWSRLRYGKVRWVQVYGCRNILIRSDDYRAFRIASCGGTQAEKIAWWRDLVALTPDVVIDVGANYGEFTAAVVDTKVEVVAIEANPLLTECLHVSFRGDDRVKIVAGAAGSTQGETQLYINPNSSGSASIFGDVPTEERRVLKRLGVVSRVPVHCYRLDTLVPQLVGRAPLSFVAKVDVEGHEASVLDGMDELIACANWWRAIVEFSPATLTQANLNPEMVWRQFRGFQGFVLKGKPSPQTFLSLNSLLPLEMPQEDCDVLIGRGHAGVARVGVIPT